MTVSHKKDMISMDEARIMLLEQRNDDFHQTLNKIDKRLDVIDKKFDSIDKRFDKIDEKFDKVDEKFDALKKEMKSDFRWILTLIIGLAGVMAHGFHWF